MIIITYELNSYIHHFPGLFGTNIIAISQLAC